MDQGFESYIGEIESSKMQILTTWNTSDEIAKKSGCSPKTYGLGSPYSFSRGFSWYPQCFWDLD
jgi:hypothetical protein